MKVVLTHALPDDAALRVDRLGDVCSWTGAGPMPRGALVEAMADADGLLCTLVDTIDGDLLDLAPGLKVVSTFSVGLDHIDLAACAARSVAVGHTPDVLTETTADTAFALLLAAARRLREGIDYVRDGRWQEWDPDLLLGRDVHSTRLGIVGMGRIGTAIARRGVAFGMTVGYWSRTAKPEAEASLGAQRLALDELLETSDHVVVACALTDDTRHIIDARALDSMKSSATLVNIGRGPLVDTDALVRALGSGSIFAAGLDVTEPEPLPADHPLLSLSNCTVIPHLGSSTVETRSAMAHLAVDNLAAGLLGEPLPRPADVG
ncbi:MAG: D-glycerate dehydrogenase [Acidimicrobiia bacterium]|nr:D-glycerate dehydrogenase [Acidimicrobiia bacterium]